MEWPSTGLRPPPVDAIERQIAEDSDRWHATNLLPQALRLLLRLGFRLALAAYEDRDDDEQRHGAGHSKCLECDASPD